MADLQLSSPGVMHRYLKPFYESESKSKSGEGCNGEVGREDGRRRIEVKDMWLALEMLSPNIAVELWTFDGRLTFLLIYNQRFHREESVVALCALVQEQLRQGLGVDLGFDVRVPGEEARDTRHVDEVSIKTPAKVVVEQVDNALVE